MESLLSTLLGSTLDVIFEIAIVPAKSRESGQRCSHSRSTAATPNPRVASTLQRESSHQELARRPDPTARPRLPPGWLVAAVALAPLLLASCAAGNSCDHPPVGVGALVTDVQAAGDPYVGKRRRTWWRGSRVRVSRTRFGTAGADLGPNLTPVGSLSTMLWLVIVRRHGVEVSSVQYLKLGALVTPVVLLAVTLTIAATFR